MLLNQLLKIKYPIIQGAMANISTAVFVAQVSNEGALGILSSYDLTFQALKLEIQTCKSLTKKPFGVNIMVKNPDFDSIMEVILEEKPAVVTFSAGISSTYIQRLKAANIKVIPVVSSVSQAKRMATQGADMVIVEGMEAGGHIGEMTSLSLLPQVVDAIDSPVIAAGGIGDGRGVSAVLSLGACGVQLGTLLLSSEECPCHINYAQAILDAHDNDTVVLKGHKSSLRMRRNAFTYSMLNQNRGDFNERIEEAYQKAYRDGNLEEGALLMGQIAGLIKTRKPLKILFEDLMSDTFEQYQSLSEKISKLKDSYE